MKTPRIVLLVLLGAGFIRAQAQDTPVPAPPEAPAETDMQKWIGDANYQQAMERFDPLLLAQMERPTTRRRKS